MRITLRRNEPYDGNSTPDRELRLARRLARCLE
jgi:hypothetical protein